VADILFVCLFDDELNRLLKLKNELLRTVKGDGNLQLGGYPLRTFYDYQIHSAMAIYLSDIHKSL